MCPKDKYQNTNSVQGGIEEMAEVFRQGRILNPYSTLYNNGYFWRYR